MKIANSVDACSSHIGAPSVLSADKAMNLAPIALFVYNRPWHTKQTVEALKKNELAQKSALVIFSDAPKSTETSAAVDVVREYIKTIDGFRSVSVVERDRNWGLANSIIDGITHLCNEYGRVIVLEDDLVTSPYFLEYMNSALDHYQADERVMQISGYMFPLSHPEVLPQTFFCTATTSWGWATWKRAWLEFEPNAKELAGKIQTQDLRAEFDMGWNYFQLLIKQERGEVDSWAIRWYASVFLAGGLCLHPSQSLVNNIGHDGTGVHCGISRVFRSPLNEKRITKFPSNIIKSELVQKQLEQYYRSLKPAFFNKVYRRLRQLFLTSNYKIRR